MNNRPIARFLDVDLSSSSSSFAESGLSSLASAAGSAINDLITRETTMSPEKQILLEEQMKLQKYFKSRMFILQVFVLVGYANMCFLSLVLLGYLRYNKFAAFKGDSEAARKIILPAYEPLLMMLAAITGGFASWVTYALLDETFSNSITVVLVDGYYCGRQFVMLIVIIFMYRKSVSTPALLRATAITVGLAYYSLPVSYVLQTYYEDHIYVVLTPVHAAITLLFVYVFFRPPSRASKRTIREYCVFALIYYALYFTYGEIFRQGKFETAFYVTYADLLWGSLCPLFVWRVLKADTEYWRGLGQRACILQSGSLQKKDLPEHVSSKGLHLLIEMHRKYVIDFAYLEIKDRIGIGASAIVFNGVLRSGIQVAIKVYTPHFFTEETVAEFAQEAALCGALNHPNIVNFYGMCVSPPTICLVSELCQGSLEEVNIAMSESPQNPRRNDLLLKVAYMLDCARAVAYLHSFNPPFLHRDIKPANFLVDYECKVKLTDFGESRRLPRSHFTKSNATRQAVPPSASLGTAMLESGAQLQKRSGNDDGYESMDLLEVGFGQISRLSCNDYADDARMTIKGTADYMAPEIINGKEGHATYSESADVYSLAITLWDIIYPGQEKYPMANNHHFHIFESVLNGQRPKFDDNVHSTLKCLIESGWQADPRHRPSVQNIVNMLETIQEEIAASLAIDLINELEEMQYENTGSIASRGHQLSGKYLGESMLNLGFVHSASESIRLGNALMDSGLLHHAKHAHAFECTEDGIYLFDEETINFCRPLGSDEINILKRSHNGSDRKLLQPTSRKYADDDEYSIGMSDSRREKRSDSTAYNSEYTSATSRTTKSDAKMLEAGNCPCRKLGQGFAVTKEARRLFRRNKHKKGLNAPPILQHQLLTDEPHSNSHPELLSNMPDAFDEFEGDDLPTLSSTLIVN